MARTVPRVIRTIPSDDTFQMSANSREEMHFSGLVPEGRNLLAIEFKNLTLANFYLRKVCSFRTFQVVTQKIKRVVEVLLYISVSYTHLRAHETPEHLVCRLLLEKKK